MKPSNNKQPKWQRQAQAEFINLQKDYQYFWNKAKAALEKYNSPEYPVDTIKQQYDVMSLQLEELKKINAEYVLYCQKEGTRKGADSYRFYNEFIKASEPYVETKRLEIKYGVRFFKQKLWLREMILRLIGKWKD